MELSHEDSQYTLTDSERIEYCFDEQFRIEQFDPGDGTEEDTFDLPF